MTTILPCDWLQGGGGGQVRWHAGGADRAEDGAQVGVDTMDSVDTAVLSSDGFIVQANNRK